MRALAPLVTALIASGKVGSGIGAELGSMRVTEQIDAMEVSGTNPFKFLVCTRVLATTITIPILATYTAFIGLVGGYLNVSMNEGISYTSFVEQFFQPLMFLDFTSSLIKSIVFGFYHWYCWLLPGLFFKQGHGGCWQSSQRRRCNRNVPGIY